MKDIEVKVIIAKEATDPNNDVKFSFSLTTKCTC